MDFLAELRRMADIVRFIGDHVPLQRAGSSWRALCPFHKDSYPSFNVRQAPPLFRCFGCGAAGDVFKFAMLRHEAAFPEAVAIVAKHFGVQLPTTPVNGERAGEAEVFAALETAAHHYAQKLWTSDGRAARDYIFNRGFRRPVLEHVRAGAAGPGWDDLAAALRRHCSVKTMVAAGLVKEARGRLFDRFRGRVMVPVFNDGGQIVGFAGRAIDCSQPKYMNSVASAHYQKARLLYGMNWARDAVRTMGAVVVMEGYFDVIRALQEGIGNVVATCGGGLTIPQARWLTRHAAEIILSFDHDAAGLAATARAVELLVSEHGRNRVAELPGGHDPDSFMSEDGPAAYRDLLSRAGDGMEWLLESLARRRDGDPRSGDATYAASVLPILARLRTPEDQAKWLRRAVRVLERGTG